MRAVVDTNVLFEGLTRRGPGGQVVDAWTARRFVPCVSTALALEYEDVLINRLARGRCLYIAGALQALLARAEFVPVVLKVRPLSDDPGDDMVIECALNGRACLVTRNVRHLRVAERSFGIPVLLPEEFLSAIEGGKEGHGTSDSSPA